MSAPPPPPPTRMSLRQRGLPPDANAQPGFYSSAQQYFQEHGLQDAPAAEPSAPLPERRQYLMDGMLVDMLLDRPPPPPAPPAAPSQPVAFRQDPPPRFIAAAALVRDNAVRFIQAEQLNNEADGFVVAMLDDQQLGASDDVLSKVAIIVSSPQPVSRAAIKIVAEGASLYGDRFHFWIELYKAAPNLVNIVDAIKNVYWIRDIRRFLQTWFDTLTISREEMVELVPLLGREADMLVPYIQKQPLVHWPSAGEIDWLVRMASGMEGQSGKLAFLDILVQQCTVPVAPGSVHGLDAELFDAVCRLNPLGTSFFCKFLEAFLGNWGKVDLGNQGVYGVNPDLRRRILLECHIHNTRDSSKVQRARNAAFVRKLPDDKPTADETKQCTLCSTNEKRLVIVPCGHHYACVACYKKTVDNKCAYCRGSIDDVVVLNSQSDA
jgi:hypothetical protein